MEFPFGLPSGLGGLLKGIMPDAMTDRSGDYRASVVRARRLYISQPPSSVTPTLDEVLEEPSHADLRNKYLIVFDRLIAGAVSSNESSFLCARDLVTDLKTGWRKFHPIAGDEDGEIKLLSWDGEEYVQGLLPESVNRATYQFKAEIADEDGDGPSMISKVVWAALKAKPFMDVADVLRSIGNTVRVDSLSFNEANAIVQELGFIRGEQKGDSECWRSPVRTTTSDDICVILAHKGGMAITPSSKVRGIEDATNHETCQCANCVKRREKKAEESAPEPEPVEAVPEGSKSQD